MNFCRVFQNPVQVTISYRIPKPKIYKILQKMWQNGRRGEPIRISPYLFALKGIRVLISEL